MRADSLNKRQFFQRGEERAERRNGGMKGVRGGGKAACSSPPLLLFDWDE